MTEQSRLFKGWDLIVGLEVHAELATLSKLFCGCPNRFGDEPNINICPICLGLPGSLPRVNATAINYASRLGRALGCEVRESVFARKNYFYPDMPKNYQVSQYDRPTNTGGSLELPDGFVIGIERAHIEEDTGKSTHVGGDGRISTAEYSLIDYNRAGVPLVEIVSKPELHSIDHAKAYVSELRDIMRSLGVSNARMEEGSMRVDANVSVRPNGTKELLTRCEIKNLNSIRAMGRAIEFEARRQIDLYENNDEPCQETRHWDEANGLTRSGRSKEDADDYRYFSEPDLVPLVPTAEDIANIDASLPVLPRQRRKELATVAGVGTVDVAILVERGHDYLALDAIEAGGDSASVLKHLINNLADGIGRLDARAFARVVSMEITGELSSNQAKAVLAVLVEMGGEPDEIAVEMGFESMDVGDLETLLDQLVVENPDEWDLLKDGNKKIQGFFIGQVMKATDGRADGKVVNALLAEKLK